MTSVCSTSEYPKNTAKYTYLKKFSGIAQNVGYIIYDFIEFFILDLLTWSVAAYIILLIQATVVFISLPGEVLCFLC